MLIAIIGEFKQKLHLFREPCGLSLLGMAQKNVRAFAFRGVAPVPHFLFCLDTKTKAKKIKATPASLQKLALVG